MEEEGKSFRGATKKGFLGRKWNYFRVRWIASRSDRNLWLTQKSKFIKTTKNLTIEQQAFIVNLFSFFSSFETIHNFFFKQKFSSIITKISSPCDRPLLNFLFYKLTFSLPLRQTIRVANRMMQMFTSDWRGKINAQRQKEKKTLKRVESAHAQQRASRGRFLRCKGFCYRTTKDVCLWKFYDEFYFFKNDF